MKSSFTILTALLFLFGSCAACLSDATPRPADELYEQLKSLEKGALKFTGVLVINTIDQPKALQLAGSDATDAVGVTVPAQATVLFLRIRRAGEKLKLTYPFLNYERSPISSEAILTRIKIQKDGLGTASWSENEQTLSLRNVRDLANLYVFIPAEVGSDLELRIQ